MELKRSNTTKNKSPNCFKEMRLWQQAVEVTNIGVWEYNVQTKNMYLSEASKRIIGFENDMTFEDQQKFWSDRIHPDDKDKQLQDYQDHLNGINEIYVNEYRIKCKDGSYKWILDKGKIVERDAQGKPVRFIGTQMDISKHAYNELSLNDTLNIITKQNNQLKNFAHIVTHNLKQHAANFESLLSLCDQSETPEEKDEIAGYLKVLSVSFTKTITNLTKIVSVQNNRTECLEKLYLAKEINEIVNALDLVIKENRTKVNNTVNPKLYIYFNHAYIESIIQNLLTNAIKYKHLDRDPEITIESFINEKTIEIKLSDNGIGIDLEKYGDSIFGLYKTFHKNADAEGIGLYLIKNQIETYGGSIGIESEVGIGTTFTISIPNKNYPAHKSPLLVLV